MLCNPNPESKTTLALARLLHDFPRSRFHQHSSSYIPLTISSYKEQNHRHRDRFFQVPNAPGTCTNVQNACNPNLNAACWQQQ
jgi:hypothetical protein